MKDYIQSNMVAYEDTAEEFQAKKLIRLKADKQIAKVFSSYLERGDTILELGTGSGQLSKILCEEGLKVDAIEFAPKMAELAKLTATQANIIIDEFIDHDFGELKYNGIIGIAFIHLFNSIDVMQVMNKINKLLVNDGVLMLATTVHNQTFDEVLRKSNFKTDAYRFRRHYKLQDFEKLVMNSGFNIVESKIDNDNEVSDKKWANILARKN